MVRFYSLLHTVFFGAFILGVGSGIALAQNWIPDTVGLSQSISSLAINSKGDLFAGAQSPTNGGGYDPNGVFLSTNSGKSWSPCPNPTFFNDEPILGPVYGTNVKGVGTNAKDEVFVGADLREAVSTDDGSSWQEIEITPQSGSDPTIDNFAIGIDGYILVATGGSSMYWSDSSGANTDTWPNQGVESTGDVYPTFVAYNPSGFFFAGTSTLLYKSDQFSGYSWGNGTLSGAPPSGFGNNVSMAFNSSGLGVNSTICVAGGANGLFLSTDNGITWPTSITPNGANLNTASTSPLFALAIGANGNIFAGLSTGGMYASTDTGKTWNDISSGLTSDTVNALAIDTGGTLYAATNNGVFQYLTSTFPSSVTPDAPAPASLTLEQNTPNPVTSSTDIQFTVPEAGQVSLNVFDATGREVATVANGSYAPGTYNVSFDAHSLADGAYYYRIESGGQNASRMFVIEH